MNLRMKLDFEDLGKKLGFGIIFSPCNLMTQHAGDFLRNKKFFKQSIFLLFAAQNVDRNRSVASGGTSPVHPSPKTDYS